MRVTLYSTSQEWPLTNILHRTANSRFLLLLVLPVALVKIARVFAGTVGGDWAGVVFCV